MSSEHGTSAGGSDPRASDPTELSDGDVVARVLAGDTERYALLVQRHQGLLFRQARGLGVDPDTAADLVQESFIKAYENLDRCRDPERFGLWVSRMLRNRCLDHFKSAPHRRKASLDFEVPENRPDPEGEREAGFVREALESALDTLPSEQREAFLLKHGEGLSYDDMAEVVGASVSAVKMRVHRARERLRRTLGSVGLPDRSAGLPDRV